MFLSYTWTWRHWKFIFPHLRCNQFVQYQHLKHLESAYTQSQNKPHQQKQATRGTPLPPIHLAPLKKRLLSQDTMETQRGVYLFCYQEVITQCFSSADGPQEKDKDQIQEPPVGHQQCIMQDYQLLFSLLLIGKLFLWQFLSRWLIKPCRECGLVLFSTMKGLLKRQQSVIWSH